MHVQKKWTVSMHSTLSGVWDNTKYSGLVHCHAYFSRIEKSFKLVAIDYVGFDDSCFIMILHNWQSIAEAEVLHILDVSD